MKVAGGILFAAALAASGCATSTAPRAPSDGGAPWIEVVSTHFVLRTDIDEAAARALDREMEQTYETLTQAAFLDVSESTRTLVVDFADYHEFFAFEQQGSAGEMLTRLPNDLEAQHAIVMYGTLGDVDTRKVITHELAHHFIHASFGSVPVWFNEGLAQYLSTARVDGATIFLGQSPLQNALPQLPSAKAIIEADRTTFYGGMTFDQPNRTGMIRTGYLYAGAFWLVHMIRESRGEAHARFAKVRSAIAGGMPFTEAWTAWMVPNGYAELEEEFRQYQFSPQLALVQVPFVARATNQAPMVRALSDVEIHVQLARLTDWRSERGSYGLEELAAAEKVDPGSAEVAYWHGVARLRAGEIAAATTYFRDATTKAPSEPRYWHGLGLAEQDEFASTRAEDALDRYRATATTLEPMAKTPSELIFVSDFEAFSKHPETATSLADRALSIDPTCVQCLLVRSDRAAEANDFKSAARFVRRAISTLSEESDDPRLRARLEKYEAAAKAPSPNPSPTQ